MRAALAAPPILAFVLAFSFALVAKPNGARADRRADLAALCDISDGSGPAPIIWQAGRVVDSLVRSGQRLTRAWRGDGDGDGSVDDAAPALRRAFQARVDRAPPRHRRGAASALTAARAAPLLAQR